MNNIESYKIALLNSNDRIQYILSHSNLPGTRANLNLMFAAVDISDVTFFEQCLTYDETVAPVNTPGELVAMCGIVGLGKLISQGKSNYSKQLKPWASDTRWRVREGVAFALQMIGEKDFQELLNTIYPWTVGNALEKRAVVAGLCEPKLLRDAENAVKSLDILKEIISTITTITDRKAHSFKVLKKGLGYGFSVCIAACPEKGKKIFEHFLFSPDKDIRWILKENLKKSRLLKMDAAWVEKMNYTLSQADI